jgi:two-component system sensor histidine kinase VicK
VENKGNLEAQLAESKMREKELQSRVEDLSDFIENASLPLHWVNGSGIIIWANQAELDLLEYTREEYIGKHISNFHADKKVCEDILDRLIKKETLHNYPAILVTKNKNNIPVLINSNVRWNGDKFLHTRCFTRDIADLRRIDKDKVNLIHELQEQNFALKAEIKALKKELESINKNV